MNLPDLMAQLSAASGLHFEPSPWSIRSEQLWHADTADGLNVSILPTRTAVMINNQLGAFYHRSPSADLRDISTTIAFGLLAARFDNPSRSPWKRVLLRLTGF